MKLSTKVFSTILLGLLLSSSLSLATSQVMNSQSGSLSITDSRIYSLARVQKNVLDSLESIPLDFEIVNTRLDGSVDIILSESSRNLLTELGITLQILIVDVLKDRAANKKFYHTYEEMEQFLSDIAENYPDIAQLNSIGQSVEGRDIWCLELSDNPGIDEQEPGVFFMGLHHAREWPTIEICLALAEKLSSECGSNDTITDFIEHRRIWIAPCINPDGYVYDHDENDGQPWWRKNRQYFSEYDTYGVDLNRNYGGSSDGNPWGMWGSSGMSHYHSDEVFCGPHPFSEPETAAVREMFLAYNISASLSWHTYGELVMWPWGYGLDFTAPDQDYLAMVGERMAAQISSQDGNGFYTPTQSAGLYPTTGDTTDWVYGYHHYVLGRPHLAYTIEACQQFHPDPSAIEQVCTENVQGALILIEEAENIQSLTPRVLPPQLHPVSFEQDGSYQIQWDDSSAKATVDYYELDELSNLYLDVDSCELEEEMWVLDGFTKSNTRGQSGTMSYYGGREDGYVSSMTTRYPVPIEEGMTLGFSCWYDIEERQDMAFVEVSTDGRSYTILDSFTGTNDEWVYHEYDLGSYAGSSIYIRFRYSTDYRVIEEGFFVDDISPIADFRTITTLSSDITETFYDLDPHVDGTYYYRVRGYNDAHGWCDFSPLLAVSVELTGNTAPEEPVFSGPERGQTQNSYSYTLSARDIDGDLVYYYISWGDGTVDEWIGPYESAEEIQVEHTWQQQGDYVIKVRAKDSHDVMGLWTRLEVMMPRSTQDTPLSFIEHIFAFIHDLFLSH